MAEPISRPAAAATATPPNRVLRSRFWIRGRMPAVTRGGGNGFSSGAIECEPPHIRLQPTARRPQPCFSTKLSITFFSPALSNATVSLLPSTPFTAP